MATLNERFDSREYGTDGSITLIYDYRDAGSDTDAAYDALLVSLPAAFTTYAGKLAMRESHPSMEPVYVDSDEGLGDYLVRVRYVAPEVARLAEEEVTVRISTQGGTKHITQAYAHIADYLAAGWPGGAPDTQGALNATKDGVEGVDVSDPAVVMVITRRYELANLPTTAVLMALRGNVNSDEVTIKDTRKNRTWVMPAGELLCEGVDEGTLDDDGLVTVTYQMAASPNMTGITIGDIVDIDKKGWEHLWVDYYDYVDGDGFMVSEPFSAHVDQVYPTVAMDGLGLDGETP